jgi:hypothetical protein
MKKNLVTQAEYGRMKGVSKQRVGVWVREGTITLTENRKVDVEIADKQLARNLDWGRRQDYEINFEERYR